MEVQFDGGTWKVPEPRGATGTVIGTAVGCTSMPLYGGMLVMRDPTELELEQSKHRQEVSKLKAQISALETEKKHERRVVEALLQARIEYLMEGGTDMDNGLRWAQRWKEMLVDTKAKLEFDGSTYELDVEAWTINQHYDRPNTLVLEATVIKKVQYAVIRRTDARICQYTLETQTPYIAQQTPGFAAAMRPFAEWNGKVWRFSPLYKHTALALLKQFYAADCEIVDEVG
jgi:hypothetical protein